MTQPPIIIAKYDANIINAIQALRTGTANEGQQRTALEWIIEEAAKTHDNPHFPGDPYQTAFNAGRAFAGQQIVKMLKLNPGSVREFEKQNREKLNVGSSVRDRLKRRNIGGDGTDSD